MDSKSSKRGESSTIELAKKLGILDNKDIKNSTKSSSNLELLDIINSTEDTNVNINPNQESSKTIKTTNKSSANSEFKVSTKDVDSFFSNNNSEDSTNTDNNLEFENYKQIRQGKSDNILAFQSFEFKGKAKEYFKIWIVNIALTLLTLGIYSAWAKVRNLRYIYGNTYLNNSNFEFNAEPKRILIGRIIVFGFYAFFLFATDVLYNQKLAGGILLIFLIILPWLVKQAIKFKLKSTSYRNIRFKYHGKARSFYLLAFYSILALLVVFSPLITIYMPKILPFHSNEMATITYMILFFLFTIVGFPIIYRKFKEIIINNSSYGESMFSFHTTKKGAISTFLQIGGATMIAGMIFSFLIYLPLTFADLPKAGIKPSKELSSIIIGIIGVVVYLSLIGLYKGITDGYLSNFTRNNTKLGSGEFKSSISPFKLGFISMTNTLATVLSLGLLYPWAKMRYLKYKLENTQFACRDYDKFISTSSKDVSTVGEEAVDFFDIDIGV